MPPTETGNKPCLLTYFIMQGAMLVFVTQYLVAAVYSWWYFIHLIGFDFCNRY